MSADLSREESIVAREGKGVLREQITGARVVIFSCPAYRSMCDALFEQFQSGAGVILYRMGEGYARKLAEALPRLGISPEEVLQGLKRLGFMAGWGKFQFLVNDDETVNCTVDNSAFVLRREGAGPTTCYFLAGILSAVGTVISGKRYIARETHCSASGEATCEFKLYPDPRESKAGGIDLRNLKLLQ